jgi:inorganic pyrophosphatase
MIINKNVSHPWHGISVGNNLPNFVNAFIEITQNDTVKYEVDKNSGILKIDRIQKFSNVTPCLYGFIPQTYCKTNIKLLAEKRGCLNVTDGDKDPLDICVLSSTEIKHHGILLEAKPIGGFKMIDKNEADDKIIAVLKDDEMYGDWNDIEDVHEAVLNKLKHYFLTYKNLPNEIAKVKIDLVYNKAEAFKVINAAILDYQQLVKDSL